MSVIQSAAKNLCKKEIVQKNAFTLAEVLITLGIIGIVAALTIPSLIAKYQMKLFEVAFKKEYSVIQNAIDFLSIDAACNNCYAYVFSPGVGESYRSNTSDCHEFKKALISKLKLTKLSNYNKSYALREDVLASGGMFTNSGCSYDYWVESTTAYLMPDGAVIFMRTPEESLNTDSYGATTLILDINGLKGPNKWGYDVFFMGLTAHKSGSLKFSDELCSMIEKGGKFPRTILKNSEQNNSITPIW